MSIKGKAYIAGVYEHPGRNLPDKSLAQIHAELCKGALEDAGLTKADVDGFFCAGDTPGLGAISIADCVGQIGRSPSVAGNFRVNAWVRWRSTPLKRTTPAPSLISVCSILPPVQVTCRPSIGRRVPTVTKLS
ncbi:MAG TPA: hypothetical protein PKO17_11270, partial [Pseudomonadales bacterium]|nr:hypothetical protein [Pseudomonadales bacterium]